LSDLALSGRSWIQIPLSAEVASTKVDILGSARAKL
jgi:hypothetical protein